MCGLVGVAGYVTHVYEKVFKNLLEVDVIRGPHSTGMVAVGPQKGDTWSKAAMLPQDFFETRQFKDSMQGFNTLLMGHNRYATVGNITTASAHPFDFEHIVGMHNGTLRNWRRVLDDAPKYQVDSECLLAHMNDNGLDVFDELDGAFALTWYDRRDHTFNILRNNERPLTIRYTKDGKTMFWASEAWMITACAGRHNVKLADTGMQVKEGEHIKWAVPKNGVDGLGKPSARTVSLYTAPPPAPYHDYYAHGNRAIGHPPVRNPPASNVAHLPGPHEAMRSRVGKDVEFYACEFFLQNHQTRQGFIQGMTANEPHHDVRVRCTEEESKELLEWMGLCEGIPRSFVGESWVRGKKEDGYLVIPVESVSMINEDEDEVEVEEIVLGPTGQPITEAEFDKLTAKGCGFCGCNVLYEDQVTWWNNEPYCLDCEEEHFPDQKDGARVSKPNLKAVS